MDKRDQQGTPNLAATSWALLGMLSYEYELSGYDMRRPGAPQLFLCQRDDRLHKR